MTTQPGEVTPPSSTAPVIGLPLARWSLAELRAAGSVFPRRVAWRGLPTAVQFVAVCLVASGVVLGSIATLVWLFDLWYGPQLIPALRGLGF